MTVPESIELECRDCPLQCNQGDDIVLQGTDLLHGLPGKFTIVKCRSCGLMRTNPRPTPESIGLYYPDDYGPYLGTLVSASAEAPGTSFRARVGGWLQLITDSKAHKLPKIKPGKLLEIGCASGSFLNQMAKKGWAVQGVEFSPKAAANAIELGHEVHVGSLESMPETGSQFDLITGWMVLEHLHDPVLGLKKLRAVAADDAWLALSVPNCNSLEFKVFKDKWYALQLPTHLYHYTPASLSKVLDESGWRIETVNHQVNINNLILSIGYYLNSRGYEHLGRKFIDFPDKAGRWNYLIFPFAWLMSKFGQTGRMTVWARPKKI